MVEIILSLTAVQMNSASDERTKIEAQLATFVEIAEVSIDDDTLAYIKDRIAALELRLRQMDL